jgi:hypothetical protein
MQHADPPDLKDPHSIKWRLCYGVEQTKLREEIVRTGHRELAKKHHPDIGGSTEQMIKLNRARDSLLPPRSLSSQRGGRWK